LVTAGPKSLEPLFSSPPSGLKGWLVLTITLSPLGSISDRFRSSKPSHPTYPVDSVAHVFFQAYSTEAEQSGRLSIDVSSFLAPVCSVALGSTAAAYPPD